MIVALLWGALRAEARSVRMMRTSTAAANIITKQMTAENAAEPAVI